MKYLVYYDTPANKKENRNYVLAATNKIDYICTALNRIGESVALISASESLGRKCCRGKTVSLSEMTEDSLQIKGRHDPCIAPRAVSVVEAAAAIAIYDAILGNTQTERRK